MDRSWGAPPRRGAAARGLTAVPLGATQDLDAPFPPDIEPAREPGNEGIGDFLSQNLNQGGINFFSQSIGLDLNSEAGDFPNISSYQSILQAPLLGGEIAAGRRGGGNHRFASGSGSGSGSGGDAACSQAGGDAGGNGSAPFRAPRSATQRNRGGRGGSVAAGAAGRSAAQTQGIANAGGSTGGTRVSTSADRGGVTPQFGEFSEAPAGGDAMDDDEEFFGHDPLNLDKANWTPENTYVFCEICCEEVRAGNTTNGFITTRGYKNIAEKYHISVGLRHSRKQLRNRWDQLRALYSFWLSINKATGLGRANGTVVADDAFWESRTKKKPEWKKLRNGPPEYLDHLQQMFQHVAVDGSSSCIPGENIGDGEHGENIGDGDHGHGDDHADGSPMTQDTRKRSSSTGTTATSPEKKSKSPMYKMMKGMLDNLKGDSIVVQKALQGEVMAESMKKAQKLAVECGADEDSDEYFMASKLFMKAECRDFFCNISTKEARLKYLKRWCNQRNMQ